MNEHHAVDSSLLLCLIGPGGEESEVEQAREGLEENCADSLSAPVIGKNSKLSFQLSFYNLASQSDKGGTEGGSASEFLHIRGGGGLGLFQDDDPPGCWV